MEITTTDSLDSVTGLSREATAPGGKLGKDEFLQVLMSQMRNQDPLDPMNSQESVAQLAQFSALEQMTNLNTQFEAMRREGSLVESMLLGGKAVTAEMKDGTTVEGTIQRVTWDATKGLMMQIGEQTYTASNIISLLFAGADTAVMVPAGSETSV